MTTLSVAYLKEKWTHTGFQKYFQNMGWMFFGRLGSMLVSFIATAYIARHLGPSNYGELSYAVSFVSIFSFIAVLGIDQVLYRDIIRYPEKKNLYMGSAMVLRLTASIIAIILCCGFAIWLSPADVSLFLIFILSISFILNAFQIINLEFQASVQSKFPSLLSLYVAISINILKIIVVVLGKGVIYLALVLLLEALFYALGYIYYRKKVFGKISQWSFDKNIAKTGALVYIVDSSLQSGYGPVKIYPSSVSSDPRYLRAPRAVGESVTVEGITVSVTSASS
ncbi:MAG: hypothetical protein EBX50_23570, partial [Chitinophagia bacterium]|nr:hypothetical protein [Chitinophagia bacterium]